MKLQRDDLALGEEMLINFLAAEEVMDDLATEKFSCFYGQCFVVRLIFFLVSSFFILVRLILSLLGCRIFVLH